MTNEQQFSPITLADLPDVVRIEEIAFGHLAWKAEKFADLLKQPNIAGYKAHTIHGSVGFMIFRGKKRYFEIVDIAVLFRGKGIGSSLIQKLVDRCDSERPRLELEVRVSNTDATSFYEHYGFRIIKSCRPSWTNGEDAFRMRLAVPALCLPAPNRPVAKRATKRHIASHR